MAEISNTYRDQVRELLKRRIQEARQRLHDGNKSKVVDANKMAEKEPAIVELRTWKRTYDTLQEQIKLLEKERDDAAEKFRKATERVAAEHYYYRTPDEGCIEALKARLVSKALSGDPELSPKLKELDDLDTQIGDLLILALTTTKLRAVVKLFNDRLGASITDVEKQILGIEED